MLKISVLRCYSKYRLIGIHDRVVHGNYGSYYYLYSVGRRNFGLVANNVHKIYFGTYYFEDCERYCKYRRSFASRAKSYSIWG